jgi:cell wall-associated NlpC family hydrolase
MSTKINRNDLRPGDLIFFEGTYVCPDRITHVGIYIGNGKMIHAGKPVNETSFETAYWQKYNPSYGRLY